MGQWVKRGGGSKGGGAGRLVIVTMAVGALMTVGATMA